MEEKEEGLRSNTHNVVADEAKTISSDIVSEIHVLVVDDNSLDRKIVERLLKSVSCKVTAVHSGKKALEVLTSANDKIDILITDYCMPEMSGYELLRHVKEDSALRNIPVVIMSSEDVPKRIQRCLEDGAEEFLLKPIHLSDVRRLKSNIWSKEKRLQATVEKPTNVPCKKRKFSADDFEAESSQRHPRLSGLTVA